MSLDDILRRTADRKALGIAKGQLHAHTRIPLSTYVKCDYVGERVFVVGSNRNWTACNHPEKDALNIPEAVCTCLTCNVKCPGHTVRGEPTLLTVPEKKSHNPPTSTHPTSNPPPPDPPPSMRTSSVSWVCGVTTVPDRRDSTLPITLQCLANGGFPAPRLFVDGCHDTASWERGFSLPITGRGEKIKAYGNWLLGIAELYIRNPMANRYAMFQDDMVCYHNLRTYLDRIEYQSNTYWNLMTFPPTTDGLRSLQAAPPSPDYVGFYPSNQKGRGAVALVFSRDAVRDLLTGQGAVDFMVERPLDAVRGVRNIDGAVVTAMQRKGYRELVHSPSLVDHVDKGVSAIGNRPYPRCPTFRGIHFDAIGLLDVLAKEVPVKT